MTPNSSKYEDEYQQLQRILIDRIPSDRWSDLRPEDVPPLSNDEAALVCSRNACMAAEGLANVEDLAIDLMRMIDYADDRFGLLHARFTADAFASIRKRAAESIFPDLRKTAVLMAEEELDDAAYARD